MSSNISWILYIATLQSITGATTSSCWHMLPSNIYFDILWGHRLLYLTLSMIEALKPEMKREIIADFYRKKWPFLLKCITSGKKARDR